MNARVVPRPPGRVVAVAAALAAALAWGTGRAAAPAKATTCALVAVPPEVYEGQPFEVEAAYRVPPAAGRATLHCELKAPDQGVLLAQTAVVEGRGTHRFRITAPARRRARRVVVALWLGEHWRRALGPIQRSRPLPVYTQEARRLSEADRAAAPGILVRLKHRRSPHGNVAVLRDAAFGAEPDLAERLAQAIAPTEDDGPAVTLLDAATVGNRFVLSPEHFDLLVLPDARAASVRGLRAIQRFLAGGGDLIAIGTPAFQRVVRPVDGQWLDADQLRERLWATEPTRVLLDFERTDLAAWRRATNSPTSQATCQSAPGGRTGRCLRIHIAQLTGWDGFGPPPLERPFPEGHTLTCLWAKGSKRTTELAVEWAERDGSRWIATVPLATSWRHYALAPSDFRYWKDNRSKGRGGPGDSLNPANAHSLHFTLAFTHTHVPRGEHTFWVDEVGTAPSPHPRLDAEEPEPPRLDTLAPAYKFHPITCARRLGISKRQVLVAERRVPSPRTPVSSHVRPQGTGCDKGRAWRWVPLIEATDRHGRPCGFPATVVVHAAPPFAGSVWAAFSYTPREVARSRALRSTIGELARRMLDGAWLLEGGSQWYTCFDDQSVTLGATAANFGRAQATVDLTLRVWPRRGRRPLVERRVSVTLEPGQRHPWRVTWNPLGFADAPYRVEATLERRGRLLDRLAHQLHVWRPSKSPSFVATEGLDFVLDGKPWYPHGVNYMPSSGIAIEHRAYFERWLGAFPYDPEVVQTDLERVAEAGMNMVSIFAYHQSIDSGNLLDILRRCQALGLKVNLSLRPGTPLDFQWDKMRAIIERYRLPSHDILFAYDLAWEPQFRNHAARRRHDAAWQRWLVDRYGSVAAAEKDWGVACPRHDGTATNPSDKQASTDGPWRVMVAAYRRFLDDLLAEHYGRARRLVRSVDPHHLVSFRMTVAGDPTISHGRTIPYDFRATACGVDVVEPEGYGRIGDWERVKPGVFTVAYARCVAPHRPCMWAEFGRSSWDRRHSRTDPDAVDWAAGFYERFYKMALLSEAAGTVCWWFPGGFRVGERSDYGIVNPDGSDRSVTKVIRRYAKAFAGRRKRSEPKHWIAIDRDAHPGGLPAIYRTVAKEFWEAMDAGQFPALRHDGQGTTSVDCPLVAVGNVPCTGHNPPKHLNALLAEVSIQQADGGWREARAGDEIALPAGQPVRARVAVVNTGFATWLSPKDRVPAKGYVHLAVRAGDRAATLHPIGADVAYLAEAQLGPVTLVERLEAPTRLTLAMVAKGRTRFGATRSLTLRPAPR